MSPINKIHVTAIIFYTGRRVRGRNNLIFLNMYKSPRSTIADNEQIHNIITNVKTFTKDNNPNIIAGGDLNMWSEVIGSNPSMRRARYEKYANGDNIIQQMGENQLININNGQPTMCKHDRGGNEMLYHVDTFWIIDETQNHIHVQHQFQQTIRITDHFPNHIVIKCAGWTMNKRIPACRWNVPQMNAMKWNQYRNHITPKIITLGKYSQSQITSTKNTTNKTVYIDSMLNTMCDILYHSVTNIIRRTEVPDIRKPYITTGMVRIIVNLQNERKGIIQRY